MENPTNPYQAMSQQFRNLVVCGTDTDVGKTVVSVWLVQGLNGTYWKPIQSGDEEDGDRGRICKLLNLPKERWIPEVYKFKTPVSPHWAAEIENTVIQPELLKIPSDKKSLVVETAGGLMVPLNREWLQLEQLTKWKLPVILVARSGLGTINHTLLSLEAMRLRKIEVLGIVLNGIPHQDNPKTIEQFGEIPVIAELPKFPSISSQILSNHWEEQKYNSAFQRFIKNLKEKV